MNTVLRASDSAEFLGLVPTLAGFTPRQSIVLLPFHGKRSYGAMRIDLPREDIDLGEYVDTAIALVSKVSETDAVAIAVYTDALPQHTPDGLVLPATVVVDELLDCALDVGLRLVDALCVTPEGWSSYLDDEPILHPLNEIPEAPSVPGVGDVGGDQHTGVELPQVGLAEKERVGGALRDLSEVLDHEQSTGRVTGSENPQALAAVFLLEDLPAFFESLLEEPENPPPFVTAALLWCLERPMLRDVALTQWATDLSGGHRALGAQRAFSRSGSGVPDDLGGVFLGRGPRPDVDRLRLALTVMRNAAARAPRLSRPGPLVAAAWLSWALGRSSHAGRYLHVIHEIDPEYGLAALIRSMLNAAMLPEWAFQRGEHTEATRW